MVFLSFLSVQIVETMSLTQPVADFYEVLGPFYEFVSLPEKKSPDTKSVLDDSPSPLTGVVNGKVPTVTASSTRMPLSHASGGKLNNFLLFLLLLAPRTKRKN